MDNKKLINDLVKYIGGKELDSYEEKVEFWKKEFLKKSSLNWSDKIIEAESNFLKSCLIKKKVLNCYNIKSLAPVDEKYNEKIIIYDSNVDSMTVDALVIPASFDITGSKDRKLHELYYCNGIKLRKKILSIMSGEKLQKNEVLITRSYNVLADYIMHVNYDNIQESIINIMECARVNMIKTLVICLDNSIEQLVEIYDVIRDYLSKFDIMFDKVILSIENKEVLEKFIEKLKEEV